MVSRRGFVFGGVTAALAGATYLAFNGQNLFYAAIAEQTFGGRLSVESAHQEAVAGNITLIDIRRPDEWASTGSGEGAQRLDMRRDDFVSELSKIVDGDTGAPVALICARGVRSARMTNILTEAGFTNIIDVPEGMLGSAAGAGWIRKGLPVVR